MKRFLFFILAVSSNYLYGQNLQDYALLKQNDVSNLIDTIWGDIEFPGSGYRINIKVEQDGEYVKYKVRDLKEFVSKNIYFGCFPYKKTFVHAPRLIQGKIDLFFYYSGPNSYSNIQGSANLGASFAIGFVGAMMQDVATKSTSYYYIKINETDNVIMVPHSDKKFKEQIAPVFKDYAELYDKIISGEYSSKQIPEIIEIYNQL